MLFLPHRQHFALSALGDLGLRWVQASHQGFQGAGFRVWIVGFSLGQHIPLRSQLGSLLFVPSEAGKLFNAEPAVADNLRGQPGFPVECIGAL